MKHYLLFLILCSSVSTSVAQVENVRYISIPNSPKNSFFYDTLERFSFRNFLINLLEPIVDIENFPLSSIYQTDINKIEKHTKSPIYEDENFVFFDGQSIDHPYANSNFEDSTIIHDDGTVSYVYPDRERFYYNFHYDELLVKEMNFGDKFVPEELILLKCYGLETVVTARIPLKYIIQGSDYFRELNPPEESEKLMQLEAYFMKGVELFGEQGVYPYLRTSGYDRPPAKQEYYAQMITATNSKFPKVMYCEDQPADDAYVDSITLYADGTTVYHKWCDSVNLVKQGFDKLVKYYIATFDSINGYWILKLNLNAVISDMGKHLPGILVFDSYNNNFSNQQPEKSSLEAKMAYQETNPLKIVTPEIINVDLDFKSILEKHNYFFTVENFQ